jgi:predicted metal-dependent HD superfamily phosphohydrolase
MMPTITLRDAWEFSVNQYPCIDRKKSDTIYDRIILEYSMPDRYYHSIDHLNHMINTLNELFKIYALNEPNENKAELYLAAFFHDLVYDPESTHEYSNEVRSAELAREWLMEMGFDRCNSMETIYELITLTEFHVPNPDGYTEVLMQEIFFDADTAILGQHEVKYKGYAKAIRSEYEHIDLLTYTVARINFLSHIKEKKAIFYTDYMNHLYSEQARINVTDELAELDKIHAEEMIKLTEG